MTITVLIPTNALIVKQTEPFLGLTIGLQTYLPELAASGGAANRQLLAEAARLGLPSTQPIQWHYTGLSGHPDDDFTLQIVLPIESVVLGTPGSPFSVRHIPAFHCAQHTYCGPWNRLKEVYDEIFEQFYAVDRVYDGRVREVFRIVDRDTPARCVLDIQIGIA